MLAIAIAATILAIVQNLIMFAFGMKEMAIVSFPAAFVGIFFLEITSIWVAYFCIRRINRRNPELALAGCAVLILGAAELALPAGFFTTLIRHVEREHVLQRIREADTLFEPLTSDDGGIRFALTYALQFPKAGHYLTFPAYLGAEDNQLFGNYFTKVHPEYYDETYVFDAGKPYNFTVVFDTHGKQLDFSKEAAHIDICDGKDYFMACHTISIGLSGLPTALATPAPPGELEPAVPAGNIRDITEKSIRLNGLAISKANKNGQPVEFSYEITNVGTTVVPIPAADFASVIAVNYACEAVSDNASKASASNPAASAGTVLSPVRKSRLAPGESVPMRGEIRLCQPLPPGDYRLHVYLFSRYATDLSKPEEELVEPFSVNP